jgi:hypothetical protein
MTISSLHPEARRARAGRRRVWQTYVATRRIPQWSWVRRRRGLAGSLYHLRARKVPRVVGQGAVGICRPRWRVPSGGDDCGALSLKFGYEPAQPLPERHSPVNRSQIENAPLQNGSGDVDRSSDRSSGSPARIKQSCLVQFHQEMDAISLSVVPRTVLSDIFLICGLGFDSPRLTTTRFKHLRGSVFQRR